MRRYGIGSTLIVSNQIEALLAIGSWDEADRLSAAALRGNTSSFQYWLLTIRADVETGRGEFDAARAHLEAANATLREDHVFGLYEAYLADLALWERRWTDADAAIQDGIAQALFRSPRPVRKCAPKPVSRTPAEASLPTVHHGQTVNRPGQPPFPRCRSSWPATVRHILAQLSAHGAQS